MREPFVGSEAIAAGAVTKTQLASRYRRLFPDVYVHRDMVVTAQLRAKAGWLWTGRRGVIAGFAAAALHGSKWVDDAQVDLMHNNRRSPPGVRTRRDNIEEDEIVAIAGMPVTSPVRTALDFGCWYPVTTAVAAIDALARATEIKVADIEVLARRYAGRRRGIARARRALSLFDAGAQSPKETWLRLVLIEAGLPRPQTQIPVLDEFGGPIAYLDMGWEDLKVAVEYDGDHHRSDRSQFGWDIRRLERLQRNGWIVVRVVAGDRPSEVVRRVRAARAQRVCGGPHTRNRGGG